MVITGSLEIHQSQFSEDRCKRLVGHDRPQPLQDVLDEMRREVAHFTGTDVLEDDFTMLALKRIASSESCSITRN